MRISTRGRYGLRAMIELARCYGRAPVLMSELAARESLSRKYLHALLTVLKEAGLVRSVRGTGGGFLLARPPSQIQLNEILFPLEGSFCLVDCVSDELSCGRADDCAARSVWARLSTTIEMELESITLQDLVESNSKSLPCDPPRSVELSPHDIGRRGAQGSD